MLRGARRFLGRGVAFSLKKTYEIRFRDSKNEYLFRISISIKYYSQQITYLSKIRWMLADSLPLTRFLNLMFIQSKDHNKRDKIQMKTKDRIVFVNSLVIQLTTIHVYSIQITRWFACQVNQGKLKIDRIVMVNRISR